MKRFLSRVSRIGLGCWVLALVVGVLLLHSSIVSYAESDGFGVSYSTFFSKTGWSIWKRDNMQSIQWGSYPSAMRIGLYGQPAELSGTVVYRVNLSGSGWLPWVENGAETGAADLDKMPLEALEVSLNGQLAEQYDIYTKVLQNGTWSDWVKNGETAGRSGEGTHIDGVRISIMKKDAGLPEEKPEIDPNLPMVALTYDDGPSVHTPRILDALERHGAKATFFVVGSSVHGANVATMQRAIAQGSEIGNHTVSHPQLTRVSAKGIRAQIDGTTTAILQATGIQPRAFRPPYGAYNSTVTSQLAQTGYAGYMWSIDTLDWKTKSSANTIRVILSQVRDGDIILMHDTQGSSAVASETVIPELIRRGYQLVTVSELAAARGGGSPGGMYGSFHR